MEGSHETNAGSEGAPSQRAKFDAPSAPWRDGMFPAALGWLLTKSKHATSHLESILERSGNSAEAVERVLDIVRHDELRLNVLAAKLQAVSCMEAGGLLALPMRAEFRSILRAAVEVTDSLREAKGQTLSIAVPETPLRLDGDPYWLQQLVSYLLENAALYAPEHTQVEVVLRRDGDTAVLHVRDQGKGLRWDELPHVFNILEHELHLRANGFRNTGIGVGLVLAKAIVTAHGGTIGASSDGPGRGSEFVVRLPAIPEELSPARPEWVERVELNCLVGRKGDRLYVCQLLQYRGIDFYGNPSTRATGFILRPVSRDDYERTRTREGLAERLRDDWGMAVSAGQTVLGLAEWSQWAYDTHGDRLLWKLRERSFWDCVRERGYPAEAFPVIEWVQSGLVFNDRDRLIQLDEVFDPEALALIGRYVEGAP